MEYLYVCRDDGGQQYMEITGCENAQRILRVPPYVDGIPVQAIASHAFEKNEEIEQVILPEGVRAVGTFAFYGCRNLRSISLTDSTESWGTGAVYFCGSLSEIHLKVSRKRYSILRDMLTDTDLGIYVRISEEYSDAENKKGSALLYFPAYTHGFDEDTYARAFHTWIEGCGFAYRETVMRTGIDFREYDLLFSRAVADGVGGVKAAANIALARLMYPQSLRETAGDKYDSYLREHGDEILQRLLQDPDTDIFFRDRVMFLLERGYVSPEAAGRAVPAAADQRDAEMVGMLMRQRGIGGSKVPAGCDSDRFGVLDEFDLDEL